MESGCSITKVPNLLIILTFFKTQPIKSLYPLAVTEGYANLIYDVKVHKIFIVRE